MDADITIVGGSLSGLTFALACAGRGVHVRVLERGHEPHQSGGALGIDRFLLLRALGMDSRVESKMEGFPILTGHRQAVSWHALYVWLHDLAQRRPEITLNHDCSASEVMQTDSFATVITTNGERIEAPVIVGADGYQSAVRKAISPEHPHALYAGYLMWRGLVSEQDLPPSTSWPQNNEGLVLITQTGYRLVAYPVAGPDGSLEHGKRLLSFAWYDKGRDLLLQESGCLLPTGQVVSSLSPKSIPRTVQEELCDLASQIWPKPWSTAIVLAIEKGGMFATPVAEYVPERLIQGRLAIIGDAAHVASPVVGQGFVAGILDSEALADALKEAHNRTNGDLVSALRTYEQTRLTSVQELVATSRLWSAGYLREKQIPSAPASEQGRADAKRLFLRTRKS